MTEESQHLVEEKAILIRNIKNKLKRIGMASEEKINEIK